MLSLIAMRKQSDQPKLRSILQDNWPGLKNVSIIKDKKEKKIKELCRLKKTKEAQQIASKYNA